MKESQRRRKEGQKKEKREGKRWQGREKEIEKRIGGYF